MSSKAAWDGKSRGGFLGYKIFNSILDTLGVGFAYFILYFVALYFLFFGGKSTKSNYSFFRNRIGLKPLKAVKNVYSSYYNFGQTILDKVAVLSKKKHPFTSTSIGADLLWDMAKKGEGGILISAHLGNWEIAGHFLHKLDVPINIVLFDGEHQRIKAMLESVMVKKKFNIIAIKDNFSHIIEINRALKAKEFICIHGDRFTGSDESKTKVFPFLNGEARFPVGPFKMVSRFKVPYCFVFALKDKKYHYNFFAFEADSDSYELDDIMKSYITRLEKMVIENPKQWYNYYPFWEKNQITQIL